LRERALATERRSVALSERAHALEWALGDARDGAAALQQAGLPGLLGVLGSHLVVEVGDEAAVAAVLGGQLQALLFARAEEAAAALEWLQARAAGPGWVVEAERDDMAVIPTALLLERSRSACPAAGLLADAV